MKLAIVGTTVLAHPRDRERCVWIISHLILRLHPALVVSGGAEGVDSLAAETARLLGVEVCEFLPTVRRWAGPGGFEERNVRIARECTHLVRLHCRSSRTYGSGWTADTAERLGRPVGRYSPCSLE